MSIEAQGIENKLVDPTLVLSSPHHVRNIDPRDDRFAIYCGDKCVASGLDKNQRDSILSHLHALEAAVSNVRRYAVFENEDGVYEHPAGNYAQVSEIRKAMALK